MTLRKRLYAVSTMETQRHEQNIPTTIVAKVAELKKELKPVRPILDWIRESLRCGNFQEMIYQVVTKRHRRRPQRIIAGTAHFGRQRRIHAENTPNFNQL
ncbi:hypothetical protein J6590_089970 [Homalodisca vitripennis]|nr:hypothetical protein J6590_089970 [Homalodisca vitripennis]